MNLRPRVDGSYTEYAVMKREFRDRILPLLSILRSIRPEQRIILLSHFDLKTKDAICSAISFTLSTEKLSKQKKRRMVKKLEPHMREILPIIRQTPVAARRKRLMQVGAGPMKHILNATIPLLLDVFPK